MAHASLFLIKLILLFCLVCAVYSASAKNHHKRDIHRIILQERSPRSHKKHGNIQHSHPQSKKRGHKNKIKKDSDESSSYEDSSSIEESFEETFHKKHKSKQSSKNPSLNRPRIPLNLDIEETRQHSYREEFPLFSNSDWIPVNSDQLHLQPERHQSYEKNGRREKERRPKRKPKKHPRNKYNYGHDYTTPLSHDSSTLYPTIDVLSTFADMNKGVLQSTVGEDRLKNHKPSYDVTESHSSNFHELTLMPEFSPMDFGSGDYNFKLPENQDSKRRGKYKNRSKFLN